MNKPKEIHPIVKKKLAKFDENFPIPKETRDALIDERILFRQFLQESMESLLLDENELANIIMEAEGKWITHKIKNPKCDYIAKALLALQEVENGKSLL